MDNVKAILRQEDAYIRDCVYSQSHNKVLKGCLLVTSTDTKDTRLISVNQQVKDYNFVRSGRTNNEWAK